jgi:4-hydroxybenzoate polyprenyltransferase
MRKLRTVLEMIKFEHTVFALPFALLGAFLAAEGFPGWGKTFWIILAMVGARSSAMAFNRLADQDFDLDNPRTSNRPLASGELDRLFVIVFVVMTSLLFVFAAWMLNGLALILSPAALAIIFFYSYTKRFTSFTHLFLGLALAVAPVGGWVAVRGELSYPPFIIALAVLFWVAGFDIFYACQDVEFDRRRNLYSFPSRLGVSQSLRLAAACHVLMILLLVSALAVFNLSLISGLGILIVAIGLIYEHRLVKPTDLSRLNLAFFTMNGIISIVLFVFIGVDLYLSA